MAISQEMMKGTVVPIMLKLLAEREMYGYELIKVVNERTENALEWKEGTIYPWLHRLEQQGLIAGSWKSAAGERRRKYYAITTAGEAQLAESVQEWTSLSTAVSALLLAPA